MLFFIFDFFVKECVYPFAKGRFFKVFVHIEFEMFKFDVNTCRSWEHFVMDCVFTLMRNIHVILVRLCNEGREQPIRVRIDEPTSVTKSQGQSVRFVCTASGSNTVSDRK